ncbi:10166_t:CDS:2 [Ambispora gerdemannii]|uniref:10166_t:CDS:1 n=1 Tax=Ambispora gerdemannii TaxID=144530 RepID=A0A9N9E089_9GLOM|nr:10166_t:CDS:2 [Ambispora gerdemannii]
MAWNQIEKYHNVKNRIEELNNDGKYNKDVPLKSFILLDIRETTSIKKNYPHTVHNYSTLFMVDQDNISVIKLKSAPKKIMSDNLSNQSVSEKLEDLIQVFEY